MKHSSLPRIHASAERIDSFVKSRRGILEHLVQSKLTFHEFGVFQLLLLLADKATGVVWTDSRKIAGNFTTTLKEHTAKYALRGLKAKGYIKSFQQQGSRDSYPILINKYEITVGDLKGCMVNAKESVDWRKPLTLARPEPLPEVIPEKLHGSDADRGLGLCARRST